MSARRRPARTPAPIVRLGPPVADDVTPSPIATLRREHEVTAREVLRWRNCGPRGQR